MFKQVAQSRSGAYQNSLSGSVLIILCCICNVLQMPACLMKSTHIKGICSITVVGKKGHKYCTMPDQNIFIMFCSLFSKFEVDFVEFNWLMLLQSKCDR